MSHLPTELPSGQERPRNWLMEALVILGILAFGYFAVTLDNPPENMMRLETGAAQLN